MVYIVYKYISTHKYTSIISRLPTCGVMCTVQYSLIVALVIASELTAGILLILSKPDVSLYKLIDRHAMIFLTTYFRTTPMADVNRPNLRKTKNKLGLDYDYGERCLSPRR